MIAGLGITFYYMATTQPWLRGVFNVSGSIADNTWWGISAISAGLWGVPLGFIVIIVVSLLTPAPNREVQELVEHVRYPNLTGDTMVTEGSVTARIAPRRKARSDAGLFLQSRPTALAAAPTRTDTNVSRMSEMPTNSVPAPGGTRSTRRAPSQKRYTVWHRPTSPTIAITGSSSVAPASSTGIAP